MEHLYLVSFLISCPFLHLPSLYKPQIPFCSNPLFLQTFIHSFLLHSHFKKTKFISFMMAEIASLWSYAENHDMEQLGQKLMCTTLELEKLKAEAMEEMRKNKQQINQLIDLLKSAIQERDEARNQFQNLLNKLNSDNPLLNPTKANSSITESNSLSENYNLHSHGSSPVDSLLDAAVSSPDFSTINSKLDHASLIIDNLAKGAILPQKGKLLQSVLQAGPLLQTLMVAGPLPRWRNPPRFQAVQLPSFEGRSVERKMASCGSAQVYSPQMFSFGNDYAAPLGKRQRFC